MPRLLAGSSGEPEKSRSRSSAKSSAAAWTGPSRRKRALAGGALGNVSGTSKVPLLMVNLWPGDSSTPPWPSVTTALRPLTRSVMSASRIGGNPSTGRTSTPLPTISIDSPSSGIGGPLVRNVDSGALVAMASRSTVPPVTWSSTQVRTLGVMQNSQSFFMAATDMRLAATPKVKRGSEVE